MNDDDDDDDEDDDDDYDDDDDDDDNNLEYWKVSLCTEGRGYIRSGKPLWGRLLFVKADGMMMNYDGDHNDDDEEYVIKWRLICNEDIMLSVVVISIFRVITKISHPRYQ